MRRRRRGHADQSGARRDAARAPPPPPPLPTVAPTRVPTIHSLMPGHRHAHAVMLHCRRKLGDFLRWLEPAARLALADRGKPPRVVAVAQLNADIELRLQVRRALSPPTDRSACAQPSNRPVCCSAREPARRAGAELRRGAARPLYRRSTCRRSPRPSCKTRSRTSTPRGRRCSPSAAVGSQSLQSIRFSPYLRRVTALCEARRRALWLSACMAPAAQEAAGDDGKWKRMLPIQVLSWVHDAPPREDDDRAEPPASSLTSPLLAGQQSSGPVSPMRAGSSLRGGSPTRGASHRHLQHGSSRNLMVSQGSSRNMLASQGSHGHLT
jgi:hypothetical protein